MEIRHLRSFLVLAEEQHFGRAATRLHIAQPALSQQLKLLEREIGAILLDRSTRRVSMTPAGALLRERATSILASVDRTRRDLSLVAAGRSGSARIGFVGTATYDVLPRVAQRVRHDLPDVQLDLRGEALGPDLIDAVQSNDLDLAVMRPTGPIHDSLRVRPLRSEPLWAVLARDHRLARKRNVALTDLADEVFVTHPSGHRSTMQPLVVDTCRVAGFEPRDLIEVSETGTLVVFVAAGLGVALVPSSVQALRLDGVAYVPLSSPVVDVPLALVHRPEPDPAVARVADVVSELVAP